MTYALAVHGGAGTIRRARPHAGGGERLPRGLAPRPRGGRGGAARRRRGALDAACAAVCALEDESLFNAGRGAAFTSDGTQEMDAAVMDGRNRSAGAVAGLFGPRNPVLAARAVMERTPHVALIGSGAAAMARAAGLPFEEPPYFFTQSPVGRPAGDAPPAGRGASVGRSGRQARHGGRGGARPCRTPGGGHVDGGHDGQDAGADGRHAGDRRGHLRRRRDLRGLRQPVTAKSSCGGRRRPRSPPGCGMEGSPWRTPRATSSWRIWAATPVPAASSRWTRPGTSPCHSTARACTAAPSAREKSPTRQSIQAKPKQSMVSRTALQPPRRDSGSSALRPRGRPACPR